MGWLAKLFGTTPKEELKGITLDLNQAFWELEGKTDFPHLLRALTDVVTDDSVLYFEGDTPNKKLLEFFNANAIPERAHVTVSTLWPRPCYYHVPATKDNLANLAEISESCAEPELAVHFHVYRKGKVLLKWHDAFSDPMLLSGDFLEGTVSTFAQALSMKFKRWENSVEQAAAQRRGKPRA